MSTSGAPELRILSAGDRALLVAPGPNEDVDRFVDMLHGAELTGMQDFLPAAETVLVTLEAGVDAAAVESDLRRLLTESSTTGSGPENSAHDEVVIPAGSASMGQSKSGTTARIGCSCARSISPQIVVAWCATAS